jgi:type II restriction enzyme
VLLIFEIDKMDLALNPDIASGYKSLSQRARVMTESWAEENLYCPTCPSDHLKSAPQNEKVFDIKCLDCNEMFQLKSKSGSFGQKVANSAYDPKIKAIRRRTNPNYLFLRYDSKKLRVEDLFLVPKYFMSPSIIERRKELSTKARRRGWVGSNILIGNLLLDARISIVEDEKIFPKKEVRNEWKRFSFLKNQSMQSRGWMADVLASVRKLDKEIFELSEAYSFEDELARLHPRNKHIGPKIRQQLQVLRDHGIIEFLGKGRYQILEA